MLRVDPIPEVEWWDKFLLQNIDDAYASPMDESKVTHYIYNPVQAAPVSEVPTTLVYAEQHTAHIGNTTTHN